MAASSSLGVPADWVSIGRACQILGVNAATLRQWTSDGRLKSYRTPGGHRRFSLAELTSLSQVATPAPPSLTDSLIAQLRARYRGMARSSATQHGWWAALPSALRERFHELGEEVLMRLGEALSARSSRERQLAAREGRALGIRYANLAREAGADTGQAVEAYLRFRQPLLDVLAREVAAHPSLGEQLGRLMRDAERFMDEVLAGLTGANATVTEIGTRGGARRPRALTVARA